MSEKNKKPQETIELNDDALEQASGGTNVGDRKEMFCTQCRTTVHEYKADGEWYCTICGQVYVKNKRLVC